MGKTELMPVVAFIGSMIVGVGKECFDARKEGGKFSWGDIVADILGTIGGIGTAFFGGS